MDSNGSTCYLKKESGDRKIFNFFRDNTWGRNYTVQIKKQNWKII